MINQQLLTYIRKQKEAGADDETIKENLESAGWRSEDIEEGFQAVESSLAESGNTSPEAHQEMREAAASKRGSAANNSQNTASTNDNKTGGDAGSADKAEDAYREPVQEENKQSEATTGQSQFNQSNKTTAEGKMAAMDTAQDSADKETQARSVTEEEQKQNSRQPASNQPEKAGANKNAYNNSSAQTVNAAAKQREINQNNSQDTAADIDQSVEPIDNNLGPTPLRTYENDKKRSQDPNTPQLTSPQEQEKGAQAKVAELSKQLADSAGSQAKKQKTTLTPEEKSKAKKQKTPEEAAMEAREKRAAKHEKSLDSDLNGEGAVDMDAAAIASAKKANSSSSSKKMTSAKSQKNSQKSGAKPKSRQTKDGKQRFSTQKNPAATKKKVAAQRQRSHPNQGSSGSNIVSLLLFVLALVLVGGGAAYAYMTYYQSPAEETSAAEIMESLATAETFDFRITIESASGTTTTSTHAIEGVADLSQSTSTQSYYTITTAGDQMQTPIRAGTAEIRNIATVPNTQQETIRDALLTPEFFSIGEFQTQERLGQTEDSDGFVTNRFSVSMDASQLVSDYATLHQALFNTALSDDVLSNLQATVAEFEATQGQAWVDTDTGVPYQITFLGTGASGDDIQINFQFKNHGIEPSNTPAYEPRSIEQVLRSYFTANPVDDRSSVGESAPTPATSTEDESSTTSEPTNENGEGDDQATSTDESTNEGTEDQTASQQRANQRLDQLRVNDVQQLSVALEVYANETGSYPQNLNSLTGTETVIVSTIPRDPQTGNPYVYSVSQDGSRYHLGATLRQLQRSDVSGDVNFNSRGQGLPAGFNGTATSCQPTQGSSATCYDVTASTE